MFHQLSTDLRAGGTRLKAHLKKHWQHHLALWGTLGAILALTLGGTATVLARGGYHFGRLPRPIKVSPINGGALPPHFSLVRYIVRIHNQGTSSSCVAQTLATIEEITQRERRHWRKFSPGYIYDQINGGRDAGATYNDAFRVLVTQGDAPLRYFPHDGRDYWAPVTPWAVRHARPYRFARWRSILPADRYTIQYEISHGRPVALALPVYSSFYNLWDDRSIPTVWSAAGSFYFWHSITLVGYDRIGVIALNSWGPAYGRRGLVRLAWPYVERSTDAVAVSAPIHPRSTRR
ncbi:MAG TPA: C1 family peptidase [Chloroflexota bacterium]|nr:C1 family peptidase [Chloroflexota bacterium]